MWTRLIVIAAVAGVALTGCSATPKADGVAASAETDVEAGEVEGTEVEWPTEAGEVCDPANANDAICAAFYPDAAAKNMFDRQPEPIASMADSERSALAQRACRVLADGGAPENERLVTAPEFDAQYGDGTANTLVYTVAGYSYCQESLAQLDPSGAWLIDHYSALGEAAAKAEFADGTMPQIPEELLPALPEGVSPDSVS